MDELNFENFEVDVLGVKYKFLFKEKHDDPILEEANGYTDFTIKEIVICKEKKTDKSLKDLDYFIRKVIRHELIHAFLSESGLDVNSDWARNEEMVDWFALQFEKLEKVFKQIK